MPNLTTAFRGRDAALRIGDGGDPQEYTLVAGVRTNAVTINNEPVNITNFGSDGNREWLPDGGVQSMSIQVDGVVVDSAAWKRAFQLALNRQFIPVQVEYPNGDVFEFDTVSTTFARNGAYNDAETFSTTLESSGTLTVDLAT